MAAVARTTALNSELLLLWESPVLCCTHQPRPSHDKHWGFTVSSWWLWNVLCSCWMLPNSNMCMLVICCFHYKRLRKSYFTGGQCRVSVFEIQHNFFWKSKQTFVDIQKDSGWHPRKTVLYRRRLYSEEDPFNHPRRHCDIYADSSVTLKKTFAGIQEEFFDSQQDSFYIQDSFYVCDWDTLHSCEFTVSLVWVCIDTTTDHFQLASGLCIYYVPTVFSQTCVSLYLSGFIFAWL